jgi:hypothetical protein
MYHGTFVRLCALSLTLTLFQKERECRLAQNLASRLPEGEGTSRPLYHRAAGVAKQDGTGGVYLYQYLVFCAHGLFG